SSGSEKQSKAVTLLKRRLEELSAGRYIPDAGKVTLANLLAMRTADTTAKGNRSRPKHAHLCKAFDVKVTKAPDGTTTYSEGWLARAITTDRVRAYEADRLQAGAARATVNQELAALRRAVKLAVEAGRAKGEPGAKSPGPGNGRQGVGTEAAVGAGRRAT